ncbi:MAG: serine hydrolase [Polyangiaceae bacterium]|nr:serine hydrolase [Polyangiaceae bacterium]
MEGRARGVALGLWALAALAACSHALGEVELALPAPPPVEEAAAASGDAVPLGARPERRPPAPLAAQAPPMPLPVAPPLPAETHPPPAADDEPVPPFLHLRDHGVLTIEPGWQESASLTACATRAIAAAGLAPLVADKSLGVALVDLSGERLLRPEVAFVNERWTTYAASVSKTLLLLSAFVLREDARQGRLPLDAPTPELAGIFRSDGGRLVPEFNADFEASLGKMIRESHNESASRLIDLVSPGFIADVAWSHRLYRPSLGGGLWMGAPFRPGSMLAPDPVTGQWHAASALGLARYFTLLAQGRLVSPAASAEMKALHADSPIIDRFNRALLAHRPGSKLYRKTGTYWVGELLWAHDAALVERGPVRYVATAVCMSKICEVGLWGLILGLDDCIAAAG